MPESYSEKDIRVTVVLDEGKGATEKIFQGFACDVNIQKSGAPEKPKASITLKGLSLDTMAAMTQLAFDSQSKRKNAVRIEAGEKGRTLSSIFQGEITSAWADFNSAPDVEFQIEAVSGSYPNLIPQSPISVKGQQKAEDAIKSLCDEIGYSFENHGVSGSISNCILSGSPVQKMQWIAETVGANLIVDDKSVVLVPKRGVRAAKGTIPVISVASGMIGYPTFDDKGIKVSSLFRPDLQIGALVQVESIVPRASGKWKITALSHELSANDPGSNSWATTITGTYQHG